MLNQKNVDKLLGYSDPIQHPEHYTKYKTEVIEITRYLPFCLGNVVKYVLRAPYKGGVEDCDKALQYLKWCDDYSAILWPHGLYCVQSINDLIEELAQGDGAAHCQVNFLRQLKNVMRFGNPESLKFSIQDLRKALWI